VRAGGRAVGRACRAGAKGLTWTRLAPGGAPAGGFVLTDDHNPVDFLRAGEALRWRERTAAIIGPEAARR